jgi:hypothetical protein
MFDCTSYMPCQSYANLEGQRSHECERGTHECVRHNDFNILRGLTKNPVALRRSACATLRLVAGLQRGLALQHAFGNLQ